MHTFKVTPLTFEAIVNSDPEKCQLLYERLQENPEELNDTCTLSYEDHDKSTAIIKSVSILHLSIICNNKDITNDLLKLIEIYPHSSQSIIDCTTSYGDTPLILAIIYNRVEAAKRLISLGCNVHIESACDQLGMLTAIHWAANYGTISILRTLLKKDISINQATSDESFTPLHIAMLNEQPKMVYFLIEMGASAIKKDKKNRIAQEIQHDRRMLFQEIMFLHNSYEYEKGTLDHTGFQRTKYVQQFLNDHSAKRVVGICYILNNHRFNGQPGKYHDRKGTYHDEGN